MLASLPWDRKSTECEVPYQEQLEAAVTELGLRDFRIRKTAVPEPPPRVFVPKLDSCVQTEGVIGGVLESSAVGWLVGVSKRVQTKLTRSGAQPSPKGK